MISTDPAAHPLMDADTRRKRLGKNLVLKLIKGNDVSGEGSSRTAVAAGARRSTRGSLRRSAWMPTIVGEREGEPGYRKSAFARLRTDDATQLRPRQRRKSFHLNNDASPAVNAKPPSPPSPQVPQMHLQHEPEETYLEAECHHRPTVTQLEAALHELRQTWAKHPAIEKEINHLFCLLEVVRTKDAFIETRLQELQQLRFAVETHYMAELKGGPRLLREERAEEGRKGAAEAATKEGGVPPIEGDVADRAASSRKGKKRAAVDYAGAACGEMPPRKRLRLQRAARE